MSHHHFIYINPNNLSDKELSAYYIDLGSNNSNDEQDQEENLEAGSNNLNDEQEQEENLEDVNISEAFLATNITGSASAVKNKYNPYMLFLHFIINACTFSEILQLHEELITELITNGSHIHTEPIYDSLISFISANFDLCEVYGTSWESSYSGEDEYKRFLEFSQRFANIYSNNRSYPSKPKPGLIYIEPTKIQEMFCDIMIVYTAVELAVEDMTVTYKELQKSTPDFRSHDPFSNEEVLPWKDLWFEILKSNEWKWDFGGLFFYILLAIKLYVSVFVSLYYTTHISTDL
jgi:hypothetical protein